MFDVPVKYVLDILVLASQIIVFVLSLRIRVAVAELKTLMYKEFVTKRDLIIQYSLTQEKIL